MTKREMLDRLTAYVKGKLKLRVPHPDYTVNHYYGEQWKAFGHQYWYQLPRNGKIIATKNDHLNVYEFSVDGFDEKELMDRVEGWK